MSRGSDAPTASGGAPALPNFGRYFSGMHTPFDAELPN